MGKGARGGGRRSEVLGQWAGEERLGGCERRWRGSRRRERLLSQRPATTWPRRGRSGERVGGPGGGAYA